VLDRGVEREVGEDLVVDELAGALGGDAVVVTCRFWLPGAAFPLAPSWSVWLYAQSCLIVADAMTGHQFEDYYARLLASLRWTGIVVIGRKPGGDGGADILATDPRGRRFAIQCKRYALTKAVTINDVRQLNGALAHEHPKHLGMIVTTSRLTPPAQQLATRSGIEIVARPALANQMARVRHEVERKDGQKATAAPARRTALIRLRPGSATGHPRLSRAGRVSPAGVTAGGRYGWRELPAGCAPSLPPPASCSATSGRAPVRPRPYERRPPLPGHRSQPSCPAVAARVSWARG